MGAHGRSRKCSTLAGLAGVLAALCGLPAEAVATTDGVVDETAAGEAVALDRTATELQAPAGSGSTGSSWEFSATAYIWFSGLGGDVATFPAVPPVDVDASFGDIFDNLNFAGMAVLQARKDRFVAMADIGYVDLGISKDIGVRDPSFLQVRLDTSNFYATLIGGYRALDEDRTSLDLMAGVRISAVDARITLNGPVRSISSENSESWVDPVVASRLRVPLGQRWDLMFYGDIGGFGVSSDLTWQLLSAVQFQLSRNWRLSGGYRYYSVDYDNDGFVYDVTMSGPILGVSVSF